jgi:hypothetical protein
MDEKLFKEADAIVAKVSENLEQLSNTIKKEPLIAQLYTVATDTSDINFEFVTQVIPELVRDLSVRRGAIGNIEQLHRKLPSPAARKKYKAALEKLLKKYTEPIDILLGQLNKIESEWPKLEKMMLPSKLYAYFGTVLPEEPITAPDSEAIEKKLQIIERTAPSVEKGLEEAVALVEKPKKPIDEKLIEVQQKIPTPNSLFDVRKDIIKLKEMVKNFEQPKINSEEKK